MLFRNTKTQPKAKDNQISLINDCKDLKFTLDLGESSADNWVSYFCSLHIFNSQKNDFNLLYSSKSDSVVSEIGIQDLEDLITFLKQLPKEPATSKKFISETRDFSLDFICRGDLYQVKANIDLCTMSSVKLESGPGDSEISLCFICTPANIESFLSSLEQWLKSSQALV